MLNLSGEKYDEGPRYDVLFVKTFVRTLVETWKMCATKNAAKLLPQVAQCATCFKKVFRTLLRQVNTIMRKSMSKLVLWLSFWAVGQTHVEWQAFEKPENKRQMYDCQALMDLWKIWVLWKMCSECGARSQLVRKRSKMELINCEMEKKQQAHISTPQTKGH